MIIEHVFHLCEELRLNPVVGYQAIEILERYSKEYGNIMDYSLFNAPSPELG